MSEDEDRARLVDRVWECRRALSLTQPWAWCIVSMQGLWKNVENRTPGFSFKSFRGDFLVHAAKSFPERDYWEARDWIRTRFGQPSLATMPPMQSIVTGGIVGIVRAVDLIAPSPTPRMPWHMEDRYGFVLEDRAELPFTEVRGYQGFWGVTEELQTRIVRQLIGEPASAPVMREEP